tara:strand:+ start:114 stop:737 length:624 start_codon:yes stop_codon:yes gene_type:complete
VKCCYNDAGEEKLITQGILYNHTLWFGLLKMSINNDYMFKHHVTEENIFSTTIIERERLPAAIWLKDTPTISLVELEKSLRYIDNVAAADYVNELMRQNAYHQAKQLRKSEIRILAAWINNSLRALLNLIYTAEEDGELNGEEIYKECYVRTTNAYRGLIYLRENQPNMRLKEIRNLAKNELFDIDICAYLDNWLNERFLEASAATL